MAAAVLFDSGGVLIGPIGGRWNPRADFEPTVRSHHPDLADERLAAGIAAGDAYLATQSATPTRDDYHRAMLAAMGIPATPALLAALDREIDPATVLEVFPEVPGVLDTLRTRGVRLAVVSDAWPDLPAVHAALGLGGYFDVYAISAVLGCTKPDPRMFRHASDGLGLAPADCLFVDDDPDLVAGALALGYQGVALRRPGAPPGPAGVPSIPDLAAVLDLL